jgi:GPI-anchor transamidase subunit U
MEARDRGAVALAAAGVLARVLLACLGWTDAASERLELASPVDALARIREGHALWGMGQSPYGGSALHAPPLYLALIGPLVAHVPSGITAFVPFLVADLAVAAAVHAVASAMRRSRGGSARGGGADASPAWVAAMYLANPFSIASCIALSSAGFRAMCIAVALAGAVHGKPPVAGAGVAALAYLGDPTCAALMMSSLAIAMTHDGGFGGSGDGARKARGRAAEEKSFEKRVFGSAGHLCAWTLGWCVALGCVSQAVVAPAGVAPMDWIRATYGFRFVAEDLSPNLGCFWYFFTEMFDNFRDFFLFVFNYFPAVLAVPVIVRLGVDAPVFCVFVARLLCVVFSPYPTLGDAAGYLALLPLFHVELRGMTAGYLVCAGYVVSAMLSPIMWRLWIVDRVANANFFFATTLAWMATQSALCVLCVKSVAEHTREAKAKLAAKKTK